MFREIEYFCINHIIINFNLRKLKDYIHIIYLNNRTYEKIYLHLLVGVVD